MKIMITILTTLALCSCSTSGISKTGLATTATVATATTLGTVLIGPAAGVVAGVAAGVTTDAVVNEESISVETLEALPVEERADALKAQYLWETIEKLGKWSIAAVLGFFLLPMLVGYFIPNRRQRRLEKMAFDHPTITNRDL